MSFHAIVHAMLAEGCSAEQIAAVVIALEQSLEREKEARREKLRNGNAERERRRRAKGKDARHACRGVTERDPFPLKESSPHPLKKITPIPNPPHSPQGCRRILRSTRKISFSARPRA